MTPLDIPPQFATTMLELYGEQGRAWLDRLPTVLARCAERWSLTLHPPFPNLSYNYVAPAVDQDGRPVVLKVGVPNPELLSEMHALRLYDGRGSARLLHADEALGAMVIERLRPGTMLHTLLDYGPAGDDQATTIAAAVMSRLWRPLPAGHSFPTVARWAAGLSRLRQEFGGGTGPFPATLVEMAEALFADLLPSQAAPVLLHGDLHHYNILRDGSNWRAIDPKGVAGEPTYEAGALLRNPLDVHTWPDLPRVMARRSAILAERLVLDRKRLVAWAVAQAVLSAWWSYDDHGRAGEGALTCAAALAPLL